VNCKIYLNVSITALLLGMIFSITIYLDAAHSLISYIFSFLLGIFIVYLLNKIIPGYKKYKSDVFYAYLILSLFGLIMSLDNVHNFLEPFAGGHDDSDFFDSITKLSSGDSSQVEVFLFEYPMAIYGAFLNTIFPYRDFTLFDLLPLNWMISALTVGLSGYLASVVSKNRIPTVLLLMTITGNFIYVDSTVHLYRDGFIMFFGLLSLILVFQKKYTRSLVFIILTGILRGANGILSLFFLIMHRLTLNIKSKKKYFITILSGLFFMIYSLVMLNEYGGLIRAISSNVDSFDRYSNSFSSLSISEILVRRYEKKIVGSTGTVKQYSDAEGVSLSAAVARVGYGLFYPIRYNPIIMDSSHNSVNKTTFIRDGVFVFNIIGWFMVSIWIIIIPLLLYGLFRAVLGSIEQRNMVVLYVVSLLMITFISMQTRHALFYITLTPIFINIAYQHIKHERNKGLVLLIAQGVTALLLILYNFYT